MAKENRDRLSRQQEVAISVLLTAPSYDKAAKAVGVHPNTLRIWMTQPKFAAAFEGAKRDLLSRTIANLQASMSAVVDALTKDLGDPSPAVRHKAAELLSNNIVKMTEVSA